MTFSIRLYARALATRLKRDLAVWLYPESFRQGWRSCLWDSELRRQDEQAEREMRHACRGRLVAMNGRALDGSNWWGN